MMRLSTLAAPGFAGGSVSGAIRRCNTPGQSPGLHDVAPAVRRPGLTLIELLITMAIMAIIAAAIMGTASAAMESARRSRTQTLVNRISQLVNDQVASYQTRRIDVNPLIASSVERWVSMAPNAAEMQQRSIARGQILADARLLGVRELMKLEMPDRVEDIEYVRNNPPLVLSAVPALTQGYLRRFTPAQAENISPAEILYIVVMNATGEGEARTQFSEQDIGDVDGDGFDEFIDGWGQPIRWIRWPAGLVSDLQPLNLDDGTRGDHDPFDPFRRDDVSVVKSGPSQDVYPRDWNFRNVYLGNIRNRLASGSIPPIRKLAFRLTPLVYSDGPDGESKYRFIADPAEAPRLDPYHFTTDGYQVGEVDPAEREFVIDNITNHLIEY